jgi:hypothetical protein
MGSAVRVTTAVLIVARAFGACVGAAAWDAGA